MSVPWSLIREIVLGLRDVVPALKAQTDDDAAKLDLLAALHGAKFVKVDGVSGKWKLEGIGQEPFRHPKETETI